MYRLALEVLSGSDQPLKAYAVLARLEERLGRQVSPPTVYRALDTLLASGRIVRIESQAAFLPVDPAETRAARVVLLCTECGVAKQVVDGGLADGLSSLAAAARFSVGRSVIEIEGRCGTCSSDGEPEALP